DKSSPKKLNAQNVNEPPHLLISQQLARGDRSRPLLQRALNHRIEVKKRAVTRFNRITIATQSTPDRLSRATDQRSLPEVIAAMSRAAPTRAGLITARAVNKTPTAGIPD